MRKLIPLAFVALLMLAAVSGMAEEAELNLLWDIPYEYDVKTFCDLAYQKTGIGFEMYSDSLAVSREDQDIQVLGYPAKISVSYWNALYIRIDFDALTNAEALSESKEQVVDEAMDRLISILTALSEKYGPLTAGEFKTGTSEYAITDEDDLVEYNFPLISNRVDYETLKSAAWAEGGTSVTFAFDNIEVKLDFQTKALNKDCITATTEIVFSTYRSKPGFKVGLDDYNAKRYESVDVGF